MDLYKNQLDKILQEIQNSKLELENKVVEEINKSKKENENIIYANEKKIGLKTDELNIRITVLETENTNLREKVEFLS